MIVQPVVDLIVNVWPQIFEAQVFQVALKNIQPQAVGQRGVNVHGFLGYTLLFVCFLKIKGAHVVQAVG